MTRRNGTLPSLRSVGRFVGLGLLLSPLCLLSFGQERIDGSADAPPKQGTRSLVARILSLADVDGTDRGNFLDPARVMGFQACKECHPSETFAWLSSKHFGSRAKIRTFAGTVKEYCDALEISKADLQTSGGRRRLLALSGSYYCLTESATNHRVSFPPFGITRGTHA